MLDYVGSVRQWPESSNIRALVFSTSFVMVSRMATPAVNDNAPTIATFSRLKPPVSWLTLVWTPSKCRDSARAENGLMVRGQRDCDLDFIRVHLFGSRSCFPLRHRGGQASDETDRRDFSAPGVNGEPPAAEPHVRLPFKTPIAKCVPACSPYCRGCTPW